MGRSNELIERTSEDEDTSHLAICLVSGGMDSCVTAAIAHEQNDELGFLHVSYGQLTETREQRAFSDLADHVGVRRRLVASIRYLKLIGGSSLTDARIAVAEADLGSVETTTSYVPYHNSLSLALA